MRALTILALFAWGTSALSIPNAHTLRVRALELPPNEPILIADLERIAQGARTLATGLSPQAALKADATPRKPWIDARKRKPEPIWTRRPATGSTSTTTVDTSARRPDSVTTTTTDTTATDADKDRTPSKTNVAHVHGPDEHSGKPHFHAGLHDVAADSTLCSNCPAAEPFARDEGARRQRLLHAEKAVVNRLIGDAHVELNKARHDDLLSDAQERAKLEAYFRREAHR